MFVFRNDFSDPGEHKILENLLALNLYLHRNKMIQMHLKTLYNLLGLISLPPPEVTGLKLAYIIPVHIFFHIFTTYVYVNKQYVILDA